jgi:CRP/FNR family transcriptional regulator, cyclic AMP receptor protein
MALDVVVQSLLKVELFAGLRPLQVAELARRSDRIVYKPGDMIISEGVIGDAAILIVQGDAVRVSGPALYQPAEPIIEGSLIGEMAMLIEATHSSTVVARSMTRAIRLTRSAVLNQIESDPGIADHLSRALARRLHDMADQLRDLDDALSSIDQSFPTAIKAFDRKLLAAISTAAPH